MNDIGRLCMKIAGRDSNKLCVIVEVLDENTVLIDGQTRRRKCNIKHLEPTSTLIEIKKGATHSDVKKAFESLKIEVHDTKAKTSEKRPRKLKVDKMPALTADLKAKKAAKSKTSKTASKKVAPKVEKKAKSDDKKTKE